LISGPHWEKNPKNINYLSHILKKTEENHSKYRNTTDFWFEFGPRVGHPWCTILRIFMAWIDQQPNVMILNFMIFLKTVIKSIIYFNFCYRQTE
jgi:hypothetical protein